MDEGTMPTFAGEFVKSFDDVPAGPQNLSPTVILRVCSTDLTQSVKARFLIDTGSNVSSLKSQIIEQLGLLDTGLRTTTYSSGGQRTVREFGVAFDLMTPGFKISTGIVLESKFTGRQTIQGILGWDFLHVYTIQLDATAGTVRLDQA